MLFVLKNTSEGCLLGFNIPLLRDDSEEGGTNIVFVSVCVCGQLHVNPVEKMKLEDLEATVPLSFEAVSIVAASSCTVSLAIRSHYFASLSLSLWPCLLRRRLSLAWINPTHTATTLFLDQFCHFITRCGGGR